MTDNINYPHIVEYLNKTLPESTGILKELEDYAKEFTVPIIQKEVRCFLGTLLKYKAPKNILELGTAIGYSSIFFSGYIKNGGKIICTGTTCCRTLESASDENGFIKPCSNSTNIFIYPGYKFKCIDTLITNFHLPESTLIMLVSAFCGRENALNAYKVAIENKYHFFSFGDSTIITDEI